MAIHKIVFVAIVLPILLSSFYIIPFLQAGVPAGFDGASHFFLSKVYSEAGWPGLDVWLPQWFQGFYFPRFYPPLTYLALGWLYRVFPDSMVEVYKIFFYIPVILTPLATLLVARAMRFSPKANLMVVILSAFLTTSAGPLGRAGGTLYSTFEIGLASQSWGNVLAILVIGFFLSCLKGKPGTGCFLGLTLFGFLFWGSNFHSIQSCLILLGIFTAFYLFQKEERKIKRLLFTAGILAVGITPWWRWYWGAFLHRHESPGLAMSLDSITEVSFFLFILLPSLILIYLLNQYRKLEFNVIVVLSVVLAALSFMLPLKSWGVNIPWQALRLMVLVFSLAPIIFAEALKCFEDWGSSYPHRDKIKTLLVAGGISILGLYQPTKLVFGALGPITENYLNETYEWMKNNPAKGYALVGASEMNSMVFFTANAYLTSNKNNPGLWTVFRESSPNSFYTVPLRNLMSIGQEEFGVDHEIRKPDFFNFTWEQKLDLVRQHGVSRFIYLNSDVAKASQLKLSWKKVYRNKLLEIYDIDNVEMEKMIDRIWIVVHPFYTREKTKGNFYLEALVKDMWLEGKAWTPIVAGASCKKIHEKLSSYITDKTPVYCIGTRGENSCCTKVLGQYSELNQQPPSYEGSVKFFNRASQDSEIFALPFREFQITR